MNIPTHVEMLAGASDLDLEVAEAALGRLPKELRALLKRTNGLVAPSGVVLYSAEELPERQENWEVEEYAPGWLVVGDDGQGRVLLVNRTSERVILSDAGELVPSASVPLAASLGAWVSVGLPLPVGSDEPLPRFVDVVLERPPAGGLKALMRIRKELNIDTPIAALKDAMVATPYRLIRKAPAGKFMVRCRRLNQTFHCLGLRHVDKPHKVLSLT